MSGTASPPPGTPSTSLKDLLIANWQPAAVIGAGWVTILGLLGVIYSGLTSEIADLRQSVASLSADFRQTNAAANAVASAARDSVEAKSLWRETHDALLSQVVPTLNQHTQQITSVQNSLNGMAPVIARLDHALPEAPRTSSPNDNPPQ